MPMAIPTRAPARAIVIQLSRRIQLRYSQLPTSHTGRVTSPLKGIAEESRPSGMWTSG